MLYTVGQEERKGEQKRLTEEETAMTKKSRQREREIWLMVYVDAMNIDSKFYVYSMTQENY